MASPRAPILRSIVPLGAVPVRLRTAVSQVLSGWGHDWQEVALAGTAAVGDREVWVFAVTAGPLAVGDELQAAGGRGQSLALSAYAGGVIPVTPHLAYVYEYLGRRPGSGAPPEGPAPTSRDMEPAAPDQLG